MGRFRRLWAIAAVVRWVVCATAIAALSTSLAPIRANSAGISTLPTYTIVNLGTLGGYNSEAYDINESGVTVGTTRTAAGLSRAFLYENGVMTDLGFPGDLYSVNESGQFAGMRFDQAIFFDGTQLIDLSLPNSYYSVAFATNDAAQVTGTAFVPGGYEAFLYESGVRTTLPSAGGDYTAAYDINQAGVVTGEVYLPGNQESRTALWHDGVLTTLQPPGSPRSYGFAINNAGEVAITGGDTTSRGFLYSNGTFTPDTRGE